MSIDEADPRLTAYVFGELSSEDKTALEAELAEDESARAQLADIQRTVDALRGELVLPKPPLLEAERRQKIAELAAAARSQKRRRLLWSITSLAGIAALALLYVGGHERKPVLDSRSVVRLSPYRDEAPARAPEAPVELVPDAFEEKQLQPSPPPPAATIEPLAPQNPGFGTSDRPRELAYREPSVVAGAKPRPQQLFEAAPVSGVGAGEWDDNANYREFMRWLSTGPAPTAHRIDIRDRRFLVVRDAAGLGVPSCRVSVTDENDRETELVTAATGRAILFPRAEGLAGRTFTATTECAGGASNRFSLSGPDGIVDLHTSRRRILPAEQVIDVAFILDSTGSMSEEIAAVKSTIQKVASGLRNSNVRIRIGLVEFKDRDEPFVTRVFPMSTDLQRFSRQVADVQASGGGDTPESGNEALHVGINQLAWSDGSLARLAFLVGDAPPHLDYSQDFDYVLEARTAAHRGIQIYTIAASGMDTLGQVVWRQVAQYTGATNLFVLRGGAGPQSVGAGDPKSSCGGTQTAYTSGNLDALVLSKIKGTIRALERDPLRIPGLNTDENAKACADRVQLAQ
jgi:hypothetical protein